MLGEKLSYFFKSGESDMASLFEKKTDLALGFTPRSGVSWLELIKLTFFKILDCIPDEGT